MVTANLNISSCVIDSPFKVINKVLQPYFYHESGNLASSIKHLSSLPAMLVRRAHELSAAKTSSRGRPYQFHPGLLSLAWLVFVSLVTPFYKRVQCIFFHPIFDSQRLETRHVTTC